MLQLKEIHGKSKETGKPWTGYCVAIGKYKTPLFFPSEIELDYIKKHLRQNAHEDFQEGLDIDDDDDDNDEDE